MRKQTDSAEKDWLWIGIDLPQQPAPSLAEKIGQFLTEVSLTVVQSALLAFLIIYFVAQATVVHGQSMEPSLHTDERLIIEKISYHLQDPHRGDIIVIEQADEPYPLIKRVVALSGETIEVREGLVLIDGQPLAEPYLEGHGQPDFAPLIVPADHVFVMGDNRFDSRDSRAFGPVAEAAILGRAWLRYWPLDEAGLID